MTEARNVRGAGSRIRTDDLLITNQLLYQLSYAGIYYGDLRFGKDHLACATKGEGSKCWSIALRNSFANSLTAGGLTIDIWSQSSQ